MNRDIEKMREEGRERERTGEGGEWGGEGVGGRERERMRKGGRESVGERERGKWRKTQTYYEFGVGVTDED